MISLPRRAPFLFVVVEHLPVHPGVGDRPSSGPVRLKRRGCGGTGAARCGTRISSRGYANGPPRGAARLRSRSRMIARPRGWSRSARSGARAPPPRPRACRSRRRSPGTSRRDGRGLHHPPHDPLRLLRRVARPSRPASGRWCATRRPSAACPAPPSRRSPARCHVGLAVDLLRSRSGSAPGP